MLINAKTLKGYKLDSRDGELGKVEEFYFDDQYWTIRYLVADTGDWLTGRQVLISPYALGAVNRPDHLITVGLTKDQIEASPALDSDKPVSRQFEEAYYGYYEWPTYWSGLNVWGYYPYLARNPEQWKHATPSERAWDPHLRSTRSVSGHHIQATDGEVGHVDDFVIDDETWTIRYLVVDTHNWLPGKKVLVSPHWIDRVSWGDRKVFVALSRETIKNSPEYALEDPLSRHYETALHLHYNRLGYWMEEPVAEEQAQ
jgi:uncharacterized protein YrrD